MTQKTSAPSYASVTGVAARPWAWLARLKAWGRAAAEDVDADEDDDDDDDVDVDGGGGGGGGDGGDGDNGEGEATYRGGTCQYCC